MATPTLQAGFAVALAALAHTPAHSGATLDTVRARGQLVCGVNTGLAGFSTTDSHGRWSGLDVDICRAVAAATLGDGEKVRFVPLNAQSRFTALQAGEIDLLSRNTTFTLSRDASLGLHVTAVTHYDGQGFMVPVKTKITQARQLKGQTVCVQSGTTTEKNMTDYSRANGLGLKPVVFEKLEAAEGAYFAGRCVAYTADMSALASTRNRAARNPADHHILPETISKEPMGPVVRRGDEDWAAIVTWTIHGLIGAEEAGVTRQNVLAMQEKSKDPVVGRLLGSTEDTGKLLGLSRDWLVRAVQTTGNYGEIYERNIGAQSALQVPRGLNRIWTEGGIQYGLPIR